MVKHKLLLDLRETVCGIPLAGLTTGQIAGPDPHDPVTCPACEGIATAPQTFTVEQRLGFIIVLSDGNAAITEHVRNLMDVVRDAGLDRLHC